MTVIVKCGKVRYHSHRGGQVDRGVEGCALVQRALATTIDIANAREENKREVLRTNEVCMG